MEAMVERGAGVDVHKDKVVVTILLGRAGKRPQKQTKTFGTFLSQLEEMRQWMQSEAITHVAMESTGPYWLPVYAVLESAGLQLVVGNAQHIKNVPGRKTDVCDSEWLAHLLRVGLIRKSFIPPPELRELRDLLRCRRALVDTRTDERNRILKLLESANIKLDSVVSDTFGVSGMLILNALAEGNCEPGQLAQFARGALRKKVALLELALQGRFGAHHRFLLNLGLAGLKGIAARIESVEAEVERRMQPYETARAKLREVPGISEVTADVIIAEVGLDMTVFGSAERLAAWAGLCPGNNESAGKKLGGKGGQTRKGNVFLKTALVEAAMAAVRTKGSYLRVKFHKLKARRGFKKAIVAIAHKLIRIVYHLLAAPEARYRDLGEAHCDQQNGERVTAQLVRRLNRLGFDVNLTRPSLSTSTG